MKIAIIGTGGVGGYFGAMLAKAGFDVTFLARGKHLEAINKNGLIVKSIDGDFTIPQVQTTNQITSITSLDLIIIGVKAWQIKDIRNDISKIATSNTTILPLQNGVLAYEELTEVIDKKYVLGGLCRILSRIESPGVIQHFGISPSILFGEMDHVISERTKQLQRVFEKAGIKSRVSDDIEAELWKKFIAICVSGLLAVTKTTYGELRELSETREMMLNLLKEIYTLSQSIGIQIKPDFIDKTVSFIDTFPYKSTSSLTRDVLGGLPSEIEYQNGTVVRLAQQYGIEVPINKFVYQSILPMELKARGKWPTPA